MMIRQYLLNFQFTEANFLREMLTADFTQELRDKGFDSFTLIRPSLLEYPKYRIPPEIIFIAMVTAFLKYKKFLKNMEKYGAYQYIDSSTDTKEKVTQISAIKMESNDFIPGNIANIYQSYVNYHKSKQYFENSFSKLKIDLSSYSLTFNEIGQNIAYFYIICRNIENTPFNTECSFQQFKELFNQFLTQLFQQFQTLLTPTAIQTFHLGASGEAYSILDPIINKENYQEEIDKTFKKYTISQFRRWLFIKLKPFLDNIHCFLEGPDHLSDYIENETTTYKYIDDFHTFVEDHLLLTVEINKNHMKRSNYLNPINVKAFKLANYPDYKKVKDILKKYGIIINDEAIREFSS